MPSIDADTRVLARLHSQPNSRGLEIYNPYFEQAGINAIYVVFAGRALADLIAGIRDLGLAGAVVAGPFESDARVLELVDEVSPAAAKVNAVGYIANQDGHLVGDYQGGYALDRAIADLLPIAGRRVSIVGTGNVVKALLMEWATNESWPADLRLYARSPDLAAPIAEEYPRVTAIDSLDALGRSPGGDLLVNATPLGSPWNAGTEFRVPRDVIARFAAVADVTFVPLKSELIATGEQLGRLVSPGYKMFFHGAARVLFEVFGHRLEPSIFEPLMITDFASNWA